MKIQSLQSNFQGRLKINNSKERSSNQGIQSIKDIITYFEGKNSSISGVKSSSFTISKPSTISVYFLDSKHASICD